uniref:Di/tri peptide transporter 2 n=1 Tax=Ganoderma boninense TaxID=34458 RepID=A0A5K1JV18_9APHY|nr:Di/tri peptide transporter 2 [Ganoderma boninense]
MASTAVPVGSPPPPGPRPIRRLQESVINRIAAGEIIHRPASALKELIENSLDAGATSIKVTVKDGGMKLLQIQDNGSGIRLGMTADPKPCAGNDGTTIVVGTPSPDVSIPSSSTTVQVIRLLYGQILSKELLTVSVSSSDKANAKAHTSSPIQVSDDEDEAEAWNAEVHFTNANYQAKKMIFLLFINHRLVESSRIKKALEAVYNGVLAKGASPFVYLSLQIDPRSVDVNVHPTKKEVHFLNEDAIIEQIADVVQQALIGQSHSRTFEYQTLLTGGIAEVPASQSHKVKGKCKAPPDDVNSDSDSQSHDGVPGDGELTAAASHPAKRKVYSQHKVRTSLKDRTLDSMFPIAHPSQRPSKESEGDGSSSPATPPVLKTLEIKESKCFLQSIRALREAVVKAKHTQLGEILTKHTFVGVVDAPRCLSLVQHNTRLYLLNHGALAAELFFQLGLRQFGNFSRIRLDPAPDMRTLVALAVDAEEAVEESGLSKQEVVQHIIDIVMARREMLQEYFNLGISEDGLVETLPMLLRDYTPNLDKLPLFLMRLGPQVDWTAEQECFESFLRELAFFYVPEPLHPDMSTDEEVRDGEKAMLWQIQHVLFPAMSRYLVPPKTLLDHDVVQVADLPDLYRVFERC